LQGYLYTLNGRGALAQGITTLQAISISEAFRAGASGYVLKQSASDELHAAIESVLANKRFLSTDRILRYFLLLIMTLIDSKRSPLEE
jgi:hypothetical protein